MPTDRELRELARTPTGALNLLDCGAAGIADLLDACATVLQLVARTLRMAAIRAAAREKHHEKQSMHH